MGSDSKPTANFTSLEAYHPLLSESINHFLTQYRNGATNFSNFTAIFSRLLQNSPDPPLEIVWFYSALTLHTNKLAAPPSPRPFWTPKCLFQLLASDSSFCRPVTRIAVLAPVISELYCSLSAQNYSKNEVESLLEGIISYINLCNGQEDVEERELSCHFVDLIRVWMVDKIGEKSLSKENLLVFFPICTENVVEKVVLGCRVGYLAGVVMCQVFLLRLVLILADREFSAMEVEKEVRDCAVQMISGMRNLYFLDVLLSMLLEPVLPLDNFLGPTPEGAVIIRKVVFDAVLTVEYSFFNPGGEIQLTSLHLTDIALKWLCVADKSIRLLRENYDLKNVIAYLTAFAKSGLTSRLLKLVTNQDYLEARIANLSTPASLIEWILAVEDGGFRVFESDVCRIYAKAAISKPMVELKIPELNLAASPAPCWMTSATINGVRKREETSEVEGQKAFKLGKYESCESSMIDKSLPLVDMEQ